MADITGTSGQDFIHRSGDRRTTPLGYNDISGATTLNDRLSGLAGDDMLYGDAGNDVLFGGTGNDRLFGMTGDDTLQGGPGDDTLAGGRGNDVYYVDSALDLVQEVSDSGNDTVLALVSHTLMVNVENMILQGNSQINGAGNALANILTGNAAANLLNGKSGDDRLAGKGGGDTLIGAVGKDSLFGGSGADRLVIQTKKDVIAGEIYDGGDGLDVLQGDLSVAVSLTTVTLRGIESMSGFAGGLTASVAQLNPLSGSLSTGTLKVANGGLVDLRDVKVGTDVITLSAAGNTLRLSGFYDMEAFGVVFDGRVNGGIGNDVIEVSAAGYTFVPKGVSLYGYGGNDRLSGGDAGDTLNGGNQNDEVLGNYGADVLTGGAGRDTVRGGAGSDRLVIAAAADLATGEIYSGGEGEDTLDANGVTSMVSLGSSTLEGIESMTGFSGGLGLSAAQLDSYAGHLQTGDIFVTTAGAIDMTDTRSVGADVITLHSGGNSLVMSAGALAEGGFAGTVNGDAGHDYIRMLMRFDDDGVSLYGNGGNDTLMGSAGDDVIDGGIGADSLMGMGGNDTIRAGSGLDYVDGSSGDDVFLMGAASDVVAGETYLGGDGQDVLDGTGIATMVDLSAMTLSSIETIRGFSGGVTMTAQQVYEVTTALQTGTLTLADTGQVDLTGVTLGLTSITLSSAGNILVLPDFAGTVEGGAAADRVYAAAAATSGLTVNGNGGADTLDGGDGADQLFGGDDNDVLVGNGGDDSLRGSTGEDVLTGGAGADLLEGGADNDTLNGSADGDTFLFTAADFGGTDVITGFSDLLDGSPIGSVLQISGGASATVYRGAEAFTGAGQTEVRFDGSRLAVDYDGNGTADFNIILMGMIDAGDVAQVDFL